MNAEQMKAKAAELRAIIGRVDVDDCVSEMIGVGNAITLDTILRAVAGGEVRHDPPAYLVSPGAVWMENGALAFKGTPQEAIAIMPGGSALVIQGGGDG
jgi:hypothetical protein